MTSTVKPILPKKVTRVQHKKLCLTYQDQLDTKEWYTTFSAKINVKVLTMNSYHVDNETIILVEFAGKFETANAEKYFTFSNPSRVPKLTKVTKELWKNISKENIDNLQFHFGTTQEKISSVKAKSPTKPLPPAIKGYRSTNVHLSNSVNTSCSNRKPLNEYLKLTVAPLHKELELQYCLLTINFLPTDAGIRSAWNLIPSLEKQITDILFQFPEVKYICSGIEIHAATKTKKKLKDQKEISKEKVKKKITIKIKGQEEEKKVSEEDLEDEDEDGVEDETQYPDLDEHNLFLQKPLTESDTNFYEAILKVFRLHDSHLMPDVTANDKSTIFGRIMRYCTRKNIPLMTPIVSTTLDNLKKSASNIFEHLQKDGLSDESKKKVQDHIDSRKAKNAKLSMNPEEPDYPYHIGIQPPPSKLVGYPHIHMAIARSKLPNQAYRSLDAYTKAIADATIFTDIRIEDSILKQYHSNLGNKRGRKVEPTHEGALGYVLKNTQHKVVHDCLLRAPCTLFNPHTIPQINQLFDIITAKYSTTINDVIQTNLDNLEVKEDCEAHYDKRDRKKLDALKRIAAFMKSKNYAFRYHKDIASVWQKRSGSKNSWEGASMTLDNLFVVITEQPGNTDIENFKESYKLFANQKTQTTFPKIDIDYYITEFGDFFYDRRSNTTTNIVTSPCFAYYPNIKLKDVTTIIPHDFIHILNNSGYTTKDGTPTGEEGRRLIHLLFEMLLEKLHKLPGLALFGDKNSGKSTIPDTLTSLFPKDKIARPKRKGKFTAGYILETLITFFEEMSRDAVFEELSEIFEGCKDTEIDMKYEHTYTAKINSNIIAVSNGLEPYADRNPETESITPGGGVNKKKSKENSKISTRTQDILFLTDRDPAWNARLQFFHFIMLHNYEIGKAADVVEEAGAVVLYLARHYYNSSPKHIEDPIALETLTKKGVYNMTHRKVSYPIQ